MGPSGLTAALRFARPSRRRFWGGLLAAAGWAWAAVSAQAQVQAISSATVTYQTYSNTNDNYSTTGGGSSYYPTGTVYNVRFNEGVSNQMFLGEVTVGGRTFDGVALAGDINIARTTNATIKGEHHIVLYEQLSSSGSNVLLKSRYAPTMEESLRSRLINHGADNVFSDQGDGNGNNNNIQRIDYLFVDGLPVHSHVEQRGFLVMDRGGNDRFKIAAITALDGNGKPSAFGTPVSVLETQWGASGISLDTIVMRGYTEDGDPQHPSADVSPQPLSGVFLNWQTLGLRTNDLFYGYALAANDTTTNGANWTLIDNATYFPTNTSPDSTFGGLDLISGGVMFYDEALNVTLGDRAWEDLDADGLQEAGEPGATNVLVYVYDGSSNLAAIVRTDTNGVWQSTGHGPGSYFAQYFLPSNSEFTARYAGTNAASDSDADLATGRTAVFAMTTGQTNLTLDAGLFRRATLGDFTWEDANGNGQQDGGEPPLANVVVRLYNAASNVVGTTTSSVAGAYAFTNLLPGAYFVDFTPPAGYFFTAANAGADATDSDPLAGTNRTALVALVSGQAETTVDAGFVRPASLGDFTWEDLDADGQQDGGEPGLANVAVRLYDATSNLLAATTSSVAGAYAFTNLLPGAYFVGFAPPAGYRFTTANAGADATDSDPLAGTNRTALVALVSGQAETTVDAGFVRPASLGDFTWVDTNGNGQQDGGEPGLANVAVRLYDAASNVVGAATSSVAGAYAFTDLFPGAYFVGFTPPAGYRFTAANAGADATDSDPLAGTNRTAFVVLTNGQADAAVDAGFVQSASLGNYTWVDANFNGQQDGGEPALANVVVRLYDAASNVVGTTTSSAAGAYAFTNLMPGTYAAGFAPPAGWSFTAANVGADATDSDADAATGLTGFRALASGQTDDTVDAGFYNPASVSLKLFKSSSLAGNWDFGATNDYYLTLQNTGTVALAGVALTDALPPGATFVAGSAQIVQLTSVVTNPFSETVSDGFGTAAYANNNGTANWSGSWNEQGDNAAAASGDVLVRVAGGTNALVFENTGADNDHVTRTNAWTAAAGRTYTNMTLAFSYRRQNWDAGDSFTFYVSTNGFVGQSNLVFAVPTTAGNDAAYVQVATNLTARMGANVALRLRAGGTFDASDRINVDFLTFTNSGYDVATNVATIYASNVTVTVISNLASATPANLLSNYTLAAGTTVTVRIRATLGAPLVSTQLVNTATATNPAPPPLVASVTNVAVANAVGDRAWDDANANGIQDGGETGVAGVAVRIYSAASNLLATTLTDSAGAYRFTNLPSGAYFLEFAAAGYSAAAPDQGGNDALDSDVDPATGRTAPFALGGGTNDASRDAGFYRLAALGDFTWEDRDGDGQQSGGEPGLANVAVTLYDAASNAVGTTTSSLAGAYAFADLVPGSYFVAFAPPAGYLFTAANAGADATDSDPLPGTNRTALVALASGQTDATVDAGFFNSADAGLMLWKSSGLSGNWDFGATNDYYLTLRNTGTVALAGIALTDVLPPGATFVEGSAEIVHILAVTTNSFVETVSDGFETASYGNNDGTANWLGDWAEVGDDGSAATGSELIRTNALVFENANANGDHLTRAIALAAAGRIYTNVTLSFSYRRENWEAEDTFALFVSTNGFATQSNLVFTVPTAAGTDPSYVPVSTNLAGCLGANVALRLCAGSTFDANDRINFDFVAFTSSGTVVSTNAAATYRAGASVAVISNLASATPTNLLANYTLPAGASVTVRLRATLGAPLVSTQLVNTATATNPVTPTIFASVTNWSAANSVGDRAWADANANGIQDGGETGVAGVTVRLYDAASNWLASTTSGADGAYRFTNLPTGAYFLEFAAAGYYATAQDQGSDDALDSDIDANGRTAVFFLSGGTNDASRDAGGYQTASLGDTTWVDSNFNGQQDGGEPALANVVVTLYDASANVMGVTTSSATGAYAFMNLVPGPYFASFSPPAGYLLTTANGGADATDSDADPVTGRTGLYTLNSGQTEATVDAGFYNPATVSLKLFKSSSLAGNWDFGATNDYYLTLQNTGTVALAGVALSDTLPPGVAFVPDSAAIVQLQSVTMVPFAETVSDGFGTVSYANNDGTVNWLGNWTEVGDGTPGVPTGGSVLVRVAGGTNALVFELTNADNDYVTRTNRLATMPGRVYTNSVLSFSYRRAGWDANDSLTVTVSTNGFVGQSNLVYTVPGQAITDAAYINVATNVTAFMGTNLALRLRAGPNFAAGDRISFDFVTIAHSGYDVATNPATTYAPGVMVNVVSNLASATPASLLSNYTLPAGSSVTVRIRATLDVPLVATQFVNMALATNPATPPLTASVTNVSVANAVGDRTWFDLDGDGIQDGGEPGLTGVTVRLYDAASNWVASTTSGVAGAYAFANLPSGSYFLEFDAPSNHVVSAQDQGGSDALDSDIDPATGRTATFALGGGTNDASRDAGFYQPLSSIGDFIWRDRNVDGLQSGGSETGMPGVVVRLYDGSSNLVATTTSLVTGAYGFVGVPTATYFLEFAAPADFNFTLRNQGGDDALDSDAAPATGRTAPFFLPAGSNDLRWDAGLVEIVYGLQLTKTSDAGSCLSPGDAITYTLTVANTGNVTQAGIAVEDLLPPGLTYVADSAQVVVSNAEVRTVRDEFNAVSYAGQDGTENWAADWQENDPYGTAGPAGNYVGVAGDRLTITYAYVGDEAAWRWADLSAETNATLAFDWETVGLDANEYLDVQIATSPSGPFTQLGQYGGTASGSASFDVTAYISTGTTIRAEATPGTENWESGEYGYLDNVEFSSTRSSVTTNPASAPPSMLSGQTLTAGGSLTVTFQATVDAPGTVSQLVNVATASSPRQPAIQASVTNCVATADVGVRKSVTDATPDLLQVIEYTVVASNNGPAVATGVVLTDVLPAQVRYNSHSAGTYAVESGEWTIGTLAVNASTTITFNVTVREQTSGLHVTNVAAVTGRDLFDPNPSNDASSVVIVPNPGVNIGNRVWFDANRDGIQNTGETNVFADIPVALLDANGKETAATVTDSQGFYLFTNLPPGTYVVRFDLASISTNEVLSTPKAGDDDELDSDAISGNVGDYAWTAEFSVAGGETTYAIDLGIAPRGSTRAEVAEMWGEWTDGQGFVAWRTASEFGTAGFFVFRVDPETGAETRLSDVLLPSAFQEDGSTYRLLDPEARAGETGTYRLDEVELTGAVLGLPAQALRFVAPPPATKAARRVSKTMPAIQVSPKAAGSSSVLKVLVKQEGIYGVSLEAIAGGMGLSLATVQALAETGSLRLMEQGRPVPTIVDAARARLLFHASAPARNWYSHEAAYLISAGDGLAMPRRAPQAAAGAAVFPVQIHFEQDQFLFAMTQMPEDFYFWAGVISQTNDLMAPRFPLDLEGYAGGDLRLKVRLMGWSSTADDPDHLAEFSFNGTVVGSIAFDDQETAEAELTVPAALVSDGENALTVNGVLQPGHSHSFFVVDWIEASFDRELAPLAIAASFRANGADSVSAAAFEEPLALALDEAGNPTWIADDNGGLPSKAWAVSAADDRFAVIETSTVPMLDPEPAAAAAWFLSRTNRIDYLVIASRALAPAAQELADYRASQGLRVGVAVFEDVCDLMAGGVRTPEAIPELLSYAAATWARPPQMVVLAGNGHYDYLGVNTSEPNHLPPMLVQTPSGVCASDALLADAGGDDLPDVAIGRLPALTPADLAAMIGKIKAYEAEFGAEWQNQLVLVSDQADSAGNFRAANARLAQWATGPYSVAERIELDAQALPTARAKLMNRFKTGAGFIHYTGHGGLHNLSAKNLLTETDVGAMTNAARPPITVALSCLAGRYEVPTTSSLGEVLLRRAQGGAVAVLGPSGLSRNEPATELGEAFYRAILQEGTGRLGLAFLQARRSTPSTLFTGETLDVYNLLGDPALRLAGNDVTNEPPAPAQVVLQDLAQTYDGAPKSVLATTEPAGLAVELTYDGSADAPVAAGTYAVVATVYDANYEGSATGTLVVAKAEQTIDFPALPDRSVSDVVELAATASSGLPVSFAVASGPAVLGGATLTFTGPGTVTVVASQAGDANWTAAADVARAFGVSGSQPGIEVSKAAVGVREAGEGRFFVRLARAPDANVVVVASRVAGDAGLTVKSGGALTFTPANWNAWRPVTLAAAADENDEDETATIRMSASGLADQFVAATALDDDLGENLARTASGATITGQNGYLTPNAIDGVHAVQSNYAYTVWTNLESPGTMTLDLQGAVTVARIRILNYDWNYRVHQYRIEASLDGQTWAVVADASAGEHSGWEDWAGGPDPVRYLRFVGLSNSANRAVCVAEWEVYGAAWQKTPARVALAPLEQVYTGQPATVTATTEPAGLAVALTYDGLAQPPVDAGTYEVVATVVDSNYAGMATGTLTVAQAAQTIDFPALPAAFVSDVVELSATASSGLPVAFAVASGPATLSGTTLAFSGTGTVVVVASQAGDANWTAAADAVRAFEVERPRPVPQCHLPAVNVREAGEGRVYVRLSMAPATNVLVGVSRSAGSTNVWVKNGTLLVFRPSNWSVWQVATLAAAADENDEDETATIRMSASGLADQFVAATALDDDLGENLARTASGATISGQMAYLAANAIDGVHTVQSNYAYTVWTNLESPGTMTLDLQCTATVARIRLLNYDWSYRVHQYRIEASPDGQAWAVVADASAGEHSGWEDWAAGPDPIRYLRFVGLSNSANRSVCVSEWEVYGERMATRLDQTIDFPAIADQVTTNVLALAATASSGLPVVFAVASGPATIADGTNLTFTGTGTVTVVASQAGDANWAAATDVARAFGVTAPPPEIEIHKAAVGVREAGEGRVYVRLSRAPATNVLVGVSRSAGSTNVWVKNGTLLVFRPSNWSVWQVATLAAAADENDEDETATIRMSASGLADQFVAATALDDDLGENLARTASGATISGQMAYLAANAIDGVHTVQSNYAYTVWTNLESPGTMTLDLQCTATVARIRLLNYDWSYRVHQYRIEASPDGQAWAVVADASAGEHSGWEDWAVGPDPVRYLRFVGLSNSANRAVCVAEWEVYGAPPAAKRAWRAPPAPAKLLEADPFPLTVVTSHDGPEHTNGWAAVDGDTNTVWEGRAGAGGWHIAVGYDATLVMTNLVVDVAEGSATQMQCLFSLDGEDWRAWPDDAAAEPVEANYLWLLFPGEDDASPAPRVIEIRPQQK